MATLLDDFNRANENPLANGNWTSIVEQTDSGGLQLTSNVVAKTGSGTTWSESYWGTTFGPDTEVTAKINTIGSTDAFALWLRVTNPGLSTMSGYLADFSFDTTAMTIYKCVSGAFTSIGTITISTYSAGDIIGFSAIGTTLTVTRNGTAIKTITDSAITGAGKVGLGINNKGSGTLDDFSADTVSTTKSIAGNINATSTLSGTIAAQKHITPDTINATSTLSGNIGLQRIITPNNVTATSTVSGTITRISNRFISGNINGTSILSGAFVLKPGNILPANIRATSTIYELGLVLKTVPAGYYGAFDTEDGIIA